MIAVQAHSRPALASELMALVKPNITLMVFITTLGGLWLAPGELGWGRLMATLLGTVLVVGAANTLNCYVERDVDRHMARTRNRPLPAGRLKPGIALVFGIGLAVISLPLLTLAVNPLTGLLAAAALVSYVLIYTPLKQHSPHAVLVGAIPGAMPPLMGWTAVTGSIEGPGLVLFGILFLWQLPHFVAISVYRQTEYDRAGILTIPAVYGARVARWYALFWSALLLPVSLLLVPAGVVGPIYFCVAAVLGIVFVGWAVAGYRMQQPARWARGFFFYTLVYLTLLFAAIVIDAGSR